MPFNKEQQRAIDSRVDENVLISAGAGSGKTKTLSSKVYKVCAEDGIKPSELLVLTFTNKAAFEMKERIVDQFRTNEKEGGTMKDEILSGHIQTFDSFSLYLVQQYSRMLKIPSTISIMDEKILAAKANAYLDEIFMERYRKKDGRFLAMLSKFNMANDAATKKVVLDLEKKLKNLLPQERKDFVEKYDEKFLSDAFLLRQKENFLSGLRKKLEIGLKKAVYLFRYDDSEMDGDAIMEDLRHIDYDGEDYRDFLFGEERLDTMFRLALHALDCDEESLTEMARSYSKKEENGKEGFWDAHGYPKGIDDPKLSSRLKSAFNNIRLAFREGFLHVLGKAGNFKEQFATIRSFREDIHLLFELVDELDSRLEEYKLLSNAYTFQDISNMALSLLIDPRYKEAGDAIKSRFKYVLVDEYQDTNDFQECFLNAISEKATLFTVGDAKQAIYGFRNSNCQLFLDRRQAYRERQDGRHTVIDMNKNYRSVEKILDDVNAIFAGYMRQEHGGIVYDGMERLDYDRGADVYALARSNARGEYGVRLLDYSDAPEALRDDPVSLECLTIIRDIQDKIRTGYPVLDFIGGELSLRPCRYKDFAVLIRKRSHFDVYQKLFLDNGVPLNNEIETGFHDIDAILAIQSLVRLLSFLTGQTAENLPHLYCSLARSYLFGKKEGYTDERIHQTLLDERLWAEDAILSKAKAFVKKESGKPFSRIFLDLLDDFDVIRKLPELGDVENNLAKIESYYQLLVAQENVGEGLKDFVSLFKDIDQYRVEVSASSVSSLEDAVDLMTIHQSKGLEFKVVYMPLCDNAMAGGNNMAKPDYLFTRTLGLLLPDYGYGKPCDTFLKSVYLETEGSKAGEISEHVRLFYVALTRPKETLFIVGKKKDLSRGTEENLLSMLDSTFHYKGIDSAYYSRHESLFPQEDKRSYRNAIERIRLLAKKREAFLEAIPGKDGKEIASYLFDGILGKRAEEEIQDSKEKYDFVCYDFLTKEARRDEKKGIALLVLFYTGLSIGEDLPDFLEKNARALKRAGLGTDEKTLLEQSSAFLDCLESCLPNDFTKKHMKARKVSLLTKGEKDLDDEEKYLRHKKKAVDLFLPALLSSVDGFTGEREETFYPLFFKRTVSLASDEGGKMQTFKAPVLSEDDTPISYDATEKRRASKFLSDEETPGSALLERGILLHRYLEVVDFKTKAIPAGIFQSEKDRKTIEKVLSLPLFASLEGARIYKEYPYFDETLESNGIIDLLVVRERRIDIVDYKLKNIDDRAYREQLETYRRNVARLFGAEKEIHTYLLSILDARVEEV